MAEKKPPQENPARPDPRRRDDELRQMVQEDIEEQRRLIEKLRKNLN